MNKEIFKIIEKFNELTTELYFKLDEEFGAENIDKTETFMEKFDDYRNSILKLDKYTDESKLINKNGFLTERYDNLPRYLKVNVIYEYENNFEDDYALCETSSGLICLIPTLLISFESI